MSSNDEEQATATAAATTTTTTTTIATKQASKIESERTPEKAKALGVVVEWSPDVIELGDQRQDHA